MKKGNFSWIIITLFRNCKYLNNKWNTDYRVGDTFRDCGLSEDRTYQWWHGVNHLTFSWSYPFSAWDFSRAFKIRLFFLVIIRFCKKESIYIFQLYRGGQFYWWRKPKNPEKTTDLSQVTVKLYHIMLYRVHLAINGVGTHNFSDNRHWLPRKNFKDCILVYHLRSCILEELSYFIIEGTASVV